MMPISVKVRCQLTNYLIDEDPEDDVIFMKEVSGPTLSEFNLAQVRTEGEPDTTESRKETTLRHRL